ncbi:MAG: glycoside hydrolase 43 family protein [Bacteroidota bacterium]
MPNKFCCLIAFFSLLFHVSLSQPSHWGSWQTWGAQANGNYVNPILPADYSDLDCIRVASDYYVISSTFQFSPGLVILHSRDLVNWTIAGHVVTDLNQVGPDLNWDKMNRYGKGIWAGAIRYHDNKFWVYFGTPDEGYFMSTAKNPAGPWAPLHVVLASKGWDDCCPFWDDDGQGYLIGTNFADGYKIHLFRLTTDGKDLIESSDKVIHQSPGSEANKLYKINGMYYHFFSEVKQEGRVVMMERSTNIYGPYSEIRQLNHAEKQYFEPNQGALLETKKGKWYFLTHHGTGDWSGRIMSLLPVTWVDGWPLIGAVGKDGIGRMVWKGRMPVSRTIAAVPQTSDEFTATTLGPQWEWNYQPKADKWSLLQRPGWLRLSAFRPLQADDLFKAGNTPTQRSFRSRYNEVIIKLDVSAMTEGQQAGLCHFANPHFGMIGIRCAGTTRRLLFKSNDTLLTGSVIKRQIVWLRSVWGLDGISRFSYSEDGKGFTAFGNPYQLAWGSYRGDRIGVFSYNNLADTGSVDLDYFHYSLKK